MSFRERLDSDYLKGYNDGRNSKEFLGASNFYYFGWLDGKFDEATEKENRVFSPMYA